MTVFAMFFATLMCSRGKNPDAFARDHASLSVTLGTVNTVLLLTSSLFVALAVQRVAAGVDRSAPRLFSQDKTVESGEFFSYYFMFTSD